MGLLGPTRQDVVRLEQRIHRLEAVVAALAEKQGLSEQQLQDLDPDLGGPALTAEVRLLVQQGRAVEAIKVLRQRTGLGLLPAKQAVDRLTGAEQRG